MAQRNRAGWKVIVDNFKEVYPVKHIGKYDLNNYEWIERLKHLHRDAWIFHCEQSAPSVCESNY